MTRVVGLTGGIGSGKSTVAALFRELGAEVIDADAIVHELQAKGSPALDEIVRAFGPAVLDASGSLDREALGRIVFADAAKRAQLGAIVHPRVGVEMKQRLEAARARDVDLVLLDIPLLLEGRSAGRAGASALPFDAVVVVFAPEAAQLERQLRRDGRPREDALQRIRAQMPLEEKKRLADFVIDNGGSLESTRAQVRALYEQLIRTSDAPA